MKHLLVFAVALGVASAGTFGQTYGNITVTGTLDVQGDLATFGSWSNDSTMPGLSFGYADQTTGSNASFTETLTRPGAAWNWQRLDGSGNPGGVMELDPANRLILTGTQGANPGSIVIDPTAGSITVSGQQVLTNGGGVAVSPSGYVGIGAANPDAMLEVTKQNPGDGAMIAGFGSTAGDRISFYDESSASGLGGEIYFSSNNPAVIDSANNLLLCPSGGYVGVGTATPPLHGLDCAGAMMARGPIVEESPEQGVQTGYGPTGDSPRIWLGNGTEGGSWEIDNWYGVMRFLTPYNEVMTAFPNGGLSVGSAYAFLSWPPNNGVIIQGNTGIGTSNPQATLDVNGNANFSGPVEIQPAGDLSMGSFTSMPQTDENDDDDDAGQSMPAPVHGGLKVPGLSGTASALLLQATNPGK